ncbi:MAG: DNA polymerase, partial [Thaumarchaeota archaeon]|nr:DNA polymerase [Nitrososphaerota archaeon]
MLITKSIKYNPTVWIPSPEGKFRSIAGEPLKEMTFSTPKEARDFIKEYSEIENFQLFGTNFFQHQYLAQAYPGQVQYDFSHLRVFNLDIETESENGYPDIASASEAVIAITILVDNIYCIFGTHEFKTNRKDVVYTRCTNEKDLLSRFLTFWTLDYPDIVTGWNTRFFDIPYLYYRIKQVLGVDKADMLSPWKATYEDEDTWRTKTQKTVKLIGIDNLDLMVLYWKYTNERRESYSLDKISNVELGEAKLNYKSDFSSLKDLYTNNYQKFIEYNLHDVELVRRINEKRRLLEL